MIRDRYLQLAPHTEHPHPGGRRRTAPSIRQRSVFDDYHRRRCKVTGYDSCRMGQGTRGKDSGGVVPVLSGTPAHLPSPLVYFDCHCTCRGDRRHDCPCLWIEVVGEKRHRGVGSVLYSRRHGRGSAPPASGCSQSPFAHFPSFNSSQRDHLGNGTVSRNALR